MMMLDILLLSIQSVFVITLPENEKLTCDEEEGQLHRHKKNFSFLQINEEIQPNIEGHLS